MKEKIRAILKSKTNWVSIVTLIAAAVGIVINFFDLGNGKLSGPIISIVLTLLAFELFTLLIGRLDSIQSALKRLESREPKGVQLEKVEPYTSVRHVIATCKKELFICNTSAPSLVHPLLLDVPDQVHIRVLVMNVEDAKVLEH